MLPQLWSTFSRGVLAILLEYEWKGNYEDHLKLMASGKEGPPPVRQIDNVDDSNKFQFAFM